MRETDAVMLAVARQAATDGRGREVRLAAGLSQAEVGGVCGVTAQAVTRWETGERRPCGEPAIRYARLLRRLGLGAESVPVPA